MLKYLFVAGTLAGTVYGQLIIKARAAYLAGNPGGADQGSYLFRMLTDPLTLSGIAGGGFAAICWILALRQLPLAYAYPFMALSFVLVAAGAHYAFGEIVTWPQVAGLTLIMAGVCLHAYAT